MEEPVVFISYATPDKTIAGLVCQALEQHHIPCWIAPRNVPAGGNAFSEIPIGIQQSTVLVLILSSNTSKSKHVSREVQIALDHSKVIIPFRTEDIQPEDSLKYILTGVQWLDAFVGPIERHLAALVECVEGIIKVRTPDTGTDSPRIAIVQQPPKRNWALWGSAAAAVVAIAAAGAFFLSRGPDDAAVHRAVAERLVQSLNGKSISVDCAGCTPLQPHVNVHVAQGQVAIGGNVASQTDVATVEAVSLSLPGVKGIAYAIQAMPQALPQPGKLVAQNPPQRPSSAQPTGSQANPIQQPVVETPRAPEAALTADQLRARAFVMTGQAKFSEQDYISAESNFQAALNLDPENAAAKRGYLAAKRALGD
jgi:TIR domain